MNKVLVILGPTSTGKTDLALSLAKKFNGELVACDSRQVYVGLDIGSGKLPSGRWKIEDRRWKKHRRFWGIDGIKVWMYDVVLLNTQYTVADYVKDANRVINDIEKRGKLPIIVGGTGLYAKALIEGLSSLETPINEPLPARGGVSRKTGQVLLSVHPRQRRGILAQNKKLRQKLNILSLKQLQKKLQKIAPEKWVLMNNSDKNNPRRLVRAIELKVSKKDPRNEGNLGNQGLAKKFDILKIGLNASRDILYEKINKRVYRWIEEGILEEIKDLRKKGTSGKRFKELGLEYAVAVEFLEGKIGFDEMLLKMQTKVRQYAKRQITWFKNPMTCSWPIFWFDISEKDHLNKVENFTTKWYHQLKITKYAAKD